MEQAYVEADRVDWERREVAMARVERSQREERLATREVARRARKERRKRRAARREPGVRRGR